MDTAKETYAKGKHWITTEQRLERIERELKEIKEMLKGNK